MLHDFVIDDDFVAFKWATEDRQGWRQSERLSKPALYTAEDCLLLMMMMMMNHYQNPVILPHPYILLLYALLNCCLTIRIKIYARFINYSTLQLVYTFDDKHRSVSVI